MNAGVIYVFVVLIALGIGVVILTNREHKKNIRQGLPNALAKPTHDVARQTERFRWFRRRVPWQEWGITRGYEFSHAYPEDSIFFAGLDDDRIVGLCLHDQSIPIDLLSVVGTPSGKPLRYQLLARWPWSANGTTAKLLASRHRDDTTTTAEQARVWVDAAFTACAACDLPRPRFVEFADASVLFVFDLHKTHEHLDRVATLHAMIREAGGVGGLAEAAG